MTTPSPILPASRPKAKREWVETLVADAGHHDKLCIVGRRGYFDDMGAKGENDYGLYDDAIWILTPNEFLAFNANTDPTRGIETGQAYLQPGRYLYELGTHNRSKAVEKQYEALIQYSGVDVKRVGSEVVEHGVFIGCNIHKGSFTKTGSEGCQTIFPDQWDEFIDKAREVMRIAQVKQIPYILTSFVKRAA